MNNELNENVLNTIDRAANDEVFGEKHERPTRLNEDSNEVADDVADEETYEEEEEETDEDEVCDDCGELLEDCTCDEDEDDDEEDE